MLNSIPDKEEMNAIVGEPLYECEYTHNKSSKNPCAICAKETRIGFAIMLRKGKRIKFRTDRTNYAKEDKA